MRLSVKWTLGLCLILAWGCVPTSAGHPDAAKTVPLKRLASSSVCGGKASSAGLVWIETDAELASERDRKPIGSGKGPAQIDVDFSRFAVLRMAMGSRPTGGYDLDLAETGVRVEDGALVIRIDWIEPAPGAMVTQMITSPCLLVRVPRDGYRRVAVVDQHGTVRFRLELP